MKKLLILLLSILYMTGCNANPYESVEKVSKQAPPVDIQSFDENGVHLYYDNKDESLFVYFKGSDVAYSDESFSLEVNEDTLDLLYEGEISGTSLNPERFYKVDVDKNYETVRLFINGTETAFTSVSGN
ncbi:hypothetical protein SAMN04487944_1223 [Gracilibacillus ureilyticus]|uniref:Uncharacterized protein n=1 Tax=Gracilibacillus ureilyticus TaxID=531814 RepID=A0A1H9V8F1_9BACI|nr:hypothetical protein [Gracilibacillus ureilyticus]SES17828.1 hypothetical protein SAMN04487944_1223 [Gracilibacillus ureilyticus]